MRSLFAATAQFGMLSLAACGQTTASIENETAQAQIDTESTPAATKTGDRDDGVLENAGEAADGAARHVGDSVHDATDGNPHTNP